MATKVKLIADGVITPDQITLTTASTGTNTTAPATTAFVQQEISALVDSSPDALNTLNELAAALGDDANFSTTVTNSIALKAPLASPDFTGDSTFDTDTLVIDSTNNRVGIGTDSPDSILHIEGSGVASLRFDNIGPSNNSALRISRDDTTISGNPLGYLEFGGKDNTGNVDTAHAYIGAIAGSHSAGSNATNLTFGTTPSGSSTIAEVMRIDSSGNVLIGHTDTVPIRTIEQRVQISGTNQATAGLSLARYQNGAFAPGIHLAKSRNGTIGAHTIVQDGDRLGDINFYGSDGTDFSNHAATIMCEVDGTPGNDDTPGRLTFHTTADGSGAATERMRIDSAGDITMSGTGAVKVPSGTTAQRPSSPANGMIRYNTTLDATEEYRGGAWVNLSAVLTATGGTITTSGDYTIHTFTSSGTFEITSGSGDIEFLVIAGGGGASGRDVGGGGGAGGYRSSVSGESSGGGGSAETALTLGKGSYTVTVGAGGAGGADGGVASQGNDSVFATITSVGGGGARSYNVVQPDDAGGGSGGGGAGITYLTGGSGTANQGYDGGAGVNSPDNDYGGGGGGGASEVGYNYVTKAGGDGVASSITGSSVTRAGGGGGAGHRSSGNGTLGAGGAGGGASATATAGVDSNRNGTANTGGGGGASKGLSQTGGTGGTGIVIVRYIP